MTAFPTATPKNRLLASLPPDELAALAPHLESVTLEFKQVVYDVDQPIEHVYFPETGMVSILGVMADGSAIETATVGNEGFVGLPVFLGTDRTSAHAFAQVPGIALRMPADALRAAIARSAALTRVLNRYTAALFTLVAQSSACNRLHTMQQRLARWLLHTHDRVGRDEFPLTHLFLSQMLGVRRATVTEAMGLLQQAGDITYEMGRVRVRDRAALERTACECYRIITREFDRLLDSGNGRPARMPNPLERVMTAKDGRSTVGDGSPRGGANGNGNGGSDGGGER